MADERFNISRVQRAFGASAERYDQHAELQHEVRIDAIELAKGCWNTGAHILDAGTGSGALAQSVNEQKLGWSVTGIDLSFDMCRVARGQGVHAVCANAESLPFTDGAFDGVFSSLMLQWANHPLEVFREWLRVTKSGGQCIVSTFTHGTLDELRESFAALDNAVHVNEFGPPNYFSALATHAGFQLLSSDEETITEYYPDVMTLLRGLKSIGATTKQGTPRRGMMTPRQFNQIEAAYRRQFAHEDGIPATWQVMTMVLGKA